MNFKLLQRADDELLKHIVAFGLCIEPVHSTTSMIDDEIILSLGYNDDIGDMFPWLFKNRHGYIETTVEVARSLIQIIKISDMRCSVSKDAANAASLRTRRLAHLRNLRKYWSRYLDIALNFRERLRYLLQFSEDVKFFYNAYMGRYDSPITSQRLETQRFGYMDKMVFDENQLTVYISPDILELGEIVCSQFRIRYDDPNQFKESLPVSTDINLLSDMNQDILSPEDPVTSGPLCPPASESRDPIPVARLASLRRNISKYVHKAWDHLPSDLRGDSTSSSYVGINKNIKTNYSAIKSRYLMRYPNENDLEIINSNITNAIVKDWMAMFTMLLLNNIDFVNGCFCLGLRKTVPIMIFSSDNFITSLEFSILCRIHILLHSLGEMETEEKSFCAWPLARWSGTTLEDGGPALPKFSGTGILFNYQYLWGLRIRSLVICYCNVGNRRGPSLSQAIFFAKKSYHVVDERFEEDVLRKHSKGVSSAWRKRKDVGIVWDDERARALDVVESGIVKLINQIFPKSRNDLDDIPYRPSPSACFEVGRKGAGNLGYYLHKKYNLSTKRKLDGSVDVKQQAEDVMEFGSKIDRLYPAELSVPLMERGKICYRMELGDHFPKVIGSVRNPLYMTNRFKDELHYTVRERGPVMSRACVVLEALKGRVVTAGESELYQIGYRWDDLVRRNLSEKFPFHLTGRPLRGSDLTLLSLKAYDFFGVDADLVLVSGDYQSATDNLDPELSLMVLQAMTARLGCEKDLDVLRRILLEHIVTYPKDFPIEPIVQRRGQLMGSPVSFPILCIVNFLINWVYIDPDFKLKLNDIPILVNGDDLLMMMPRSWYHRHPYLREFQALHLDDGLSWSSWVSIFGLTPSLGKNYCSEQMCSINSKFYTVLKKKVVSYGDNDTIGTLPIGSEHSEVSCSEYKRAYLIFKFHDYSRTHLLNGSCRVQSRESSGFTREHSLEEKVKMFRRGCNSPDWISVLRESCGDQLKFGSFRLPSWCGGWGIIQDFQGMTDLEKMVMGTIVRTHSIIPKFVTDSSVVPIYSAKTSRKFERKFRLINRFLDPVESLFGDVYEVSHLHDPLSFEFVDDIDKRRPHPSGLFHVPRQLLSTISEYLYNQLFENPPSVGLVGERDEQFTFRTAVKLRFDGECDG